MTSALASIKCQVIFYNSAKDVISCSGSFEILGFYFPQLELVHRVYGPKRWNLEITTEIFCAMQIHLTPAITDVKGTK